MHFMGPSKARTLEMLRSASPEEHLPIQLGQYEVKGIIEREGEDWVLVQMAIDHDEAREEGERRMAAGQPWFPEMAGMFNRPVGIWARASSAAELATLIERKDHGLFG